MKMADYANAILNDIEADLASARKSRDRIEQAIETLRQEGVPSETLSQVVPWLQAEQNRVRMLMIHRFAFRAGMRDKGWLD